MTIQDVLPLKNEGFIQPTVLERDVPTRCFPGVSGESLYYVHEKRLTDGDTTRPLSLRLLFLLIDSGTEVRPLYPTNYDWVYSVLFTELGETTYLGLSLFSPDIHQFFRETSSNLTRPGPIH